MDDRTAAPLRRYAKFSGRARRAEYWWFILATLVVSTIASCLDQTLGHPSLGLGLVVSLGLLLPKLAVGVRRLHDIGRSGWWLAGPLVLAIPLGLIFGLAMVREQMPSGAAIGILAIAFLAYAITLLVWTCRRGIVGDNRFGPDPIDGPLAPQL